MPNVHGINEPRARFVAASATTPERVVRDARARWAMAPTLDQLTDFIGKALTDLRLF
jgi:hypothetical protein